jgi:NSS family neurotransmitter:Na+ symporter
MVSVTVFSTVICAAGLQKGVEKCVKFMMSLLFFMLIILAARCCFLPGAAKALKFYLLPDFSRMADSGIWATLYAAMGQSFFTISIGIGCMAIFGSYIDKSRRLGGESAVIILLDTFVALLAGLIIFPICFSFNVDVAQGPGLVFVSLPNIFNNMPFAKITGAAFFFFLLLAALTTLVAVIENIAAFIIDEFGVKRKKAAVLSGFGVTLLSIPCALGFGVLKNIQPLGKGSTILDLEDFIVSYCLLPLGSLVYVLFCTSKMIW